MAPKTIPRSRAGRKAAWERHVGRTLQEQVPGDEAPLKVDREKGIIYGVKVLGRFSKNTHDTDGVTGTEYSDRARKQACELYEGMTVRVDHPDRKNPTASRSVHDTFGQLRKCRLDEHGDVRADLHYLKSHDLAEAVCEDVERGLGVYGLSHNARAGRESVRDGRLVIEELELVRSVDLVDKPATNRNLWESETVTTKTTLRQLLEEALDDLSKARKDWANHLLEDGEPYMDAEVEEPPADPDEAMSAAFEQSGTAILQQIIAGELDAKEGLAKLKDLLMTHEKLTAKEEPEQSPDEVAEEEEKDVKEGEECKPGMKKDKEESLKERLDSFERKDRARDLCESMEVAPSKALLKALIAPGLTVTDQKEIIGEFKGAATTARGPRSRGPGRGRNVTESRRPAGGASAPANTKGLLNRIR